MNDLTPGTWTIELQHSSVGFTVRHLGLSKVRGQFNRFSGQLEIGDDQLTSSVEATIDLASIDTNNPDRDGHLQSTDFFSVEHHPEMTFRSTGVRAAGADFVVDGELTVNGITQPVALDLEFHGLATDPYGTTRAGFSASAQISRGDFGIDFQVPLDAGRVLVGDKVTVELEVQAVPAQVPAVV
ncbi:MAG: YceI family protein [Acidimicrobiia bacterium]|nr:YceI family protein [Acidimicrobiia bacterium]